MSGLKMKLGNSFEIKEILVDQPIAKLVLQPDHPNMPEGYIAHQLVDLLSKELMARCEIIHYKRSVTTGKIYGGYYDYIPAVDPHCETIYEGRVPLFNELQLEINNLRKENEMLKLGIK